MTAVHLISFGYLHGEPPQAHVTADVRDHFRDPHVSPGLRNLTGEDGRVIEAVLATPGVSRLIVSLSCAALAYLDGPQSRPVTIAIGCAGGRHRSAVIASKVADRLTGAGAHVTVTHRDIGRPVVERDTGTGKQIFTCITHCYHSSAGPCPKCAEQAVWHACPDCTAPAGVICQPGCSNPSGGRGKHSQFPEVTP